MREDFSSSLTAPVDDGAAAHLPGRRWPAIALASTSGRLVRLDGDANERTVVFCYPRTGKSGEVPSAEWIRTPGAFGCTAEACGFRDLHERFAALRTRVFGLSTQTTTYQREMVERLGIEFEVLSDSGLRLTRALGLPTLEMRGATLLVEEHEQRGAAYHC